MQPYFDNNGFPAAADFISVSTGTQENRVNYPPNLWLESEGWTAPLIVDDEHGSVANAFGLSAYPFWAGVDGSGRVVFRTTGTLSGGQIEDLAQALADN